MNAVASIDFDRDYFNAYYANWVRYRSRWRRFAIPIALSFVAVTALASFRLESHRPIAGGLFVFAALNLIDAITHRQRWIRQRLASVAVDKFAKLTFNDDHLQILTTNTEGTVRYEAFGVVAVTPDGIFLVPDSGHSIFIPRNAFSTDDEFRLVSNKLAEQVACYSV
ncbi:MAG: YcxB family protein [Planctomycetaceae bacterium]|nr:MAG: YcxB family protein [Planctomycetaceae bacterium]